MVRANIGTSCEGRAFWGDVQSDVIRRELVKPSFLDGMVRIVS